MIPSIMEEKKYCLRDNGYLQCPIYCSSQTIGQRGEAAEGSNFTPWGGIGIPFPEILTIPSD